MLQVHIHDTTVTEKFKVSTPAATQAFLVAFEIPSKPCQSVPEAGCLRLTAIFFSV